MAEQVFWFPLPYCSPPGRPFPIKSLALSAHVSPWTIHFQVLDKSPVSGPGRGPPSCNITIKIEKIKPKIRRRKKNNKDINVVNKTMVITVINNN